MTEVGNAIMENGGLEREGGGTGELVKFLDEANGRLKKRKEGGQFWGRCIADSRKAKVRS